MYLSTQPFYLFIQIVVHQDFEDVELVPVDVTGNAKQAGGT